MVHRTTNIINQLKIHINLTLNNTRTQKHTKKIIKQVSIKKQIEFRFNSLQSEVKEAYLIEERLNSIVIAIRSIAKTIEHWYLAEFQLVQLQQLNSIHSLTDSSKTW